MRRSSVNAVPPGVLAIVRDQVLPPRDRPLSCVNVRCPAPPPSPARPRLLPHHRMVAQQLDDPELFLRRPPAPRRCLGDHFDPLVAVRPALDDIPKPPCLRRMSVRNGGQFTDPLKRRELGDRIGRLDPTHRVRPMPDVSPDATVPPHGRKTGATIRLRFRPLLQRSGVSRPALTGPCRRHTPDPASLSGVLPPSDGQAAWPRPPACRSGRSRNARPLAQAR